MATITAQTQLHEIIPFKNGEITIKDIVPTWSESDIPLPPPSRKPVDILEADKITPDSHVPRDPRLIRLTGVHPFNVEPPLTALYNEGIASVTCSCTENNLVNRLPHLSGVILRSKSWTGAPSPRRRDSGLGDQHRRVI